MLILGLNTFHADSSAALVRDGKLVAAIAEERLNRVKHFYGFPELAIRRVLEIAGASIQDVDHIAIARDSTANLMSKVGYLLMNLGRINKIARQRIENRAKIASIPELIEKSFALSPNTLRARIHRIEHHLAHAASCFLVSPFDDAAIMTCDGFGDFASSLLASAKGSEINVMERTLFPHSLGVLYSAICQFIGYVKYGDEGKVMGLAPYGKSPDMLDDILSLKANGKYELNLDYFIHHTEGVDYSADESGKPTSARVFSKKLIDRFGPARLPGSEITQRDMDLALSLQTMTEKAYFHILNHLHRAVPVERLCLAGGVALNSVANGRIFEHTPFRKVYIQPAAGDDGTALGAAFLVSNVVLEQPRSYVMRSALVGDEFDSNACQHALRDANLPFEKLERDELSKRIAASLAQGLVVGFYQGRMEWGPRALGCRSILAHPGFPGMKDILNSRIKHREWFRPFAPAVLENRVGDVFEHDHPDPFMLFVYKIRPEWRERLSAVCHVDNTGRLQTVSRDVNPLYYQVIAEFEKITGIPVVLNTSFNENEPIVHAPAEAVDCFVRTKMDVLVLDDCLVRR